MHIAERAMYNALAMMFKTSAIVLSFGIISISLPFNQKVVANLCYTDTKSEYANIIGTIYKAPNGQT